LRFDFHQEAVLQTQTLCGPESRRGSDMATAIARKPMTFGEGGAAIAFTAASDIVPASSS
jgi:hypothetical protein